MATSFATYDAIVDSFGANVVSYWKFQGDGSDRQGTQDAPLTGTPETGVPTIVALDTVAEGAADGTVLAWPGTPGVYAEAAHNAAHKTASGAIVVTFQCDILDAKAVLVAGDANTAAGGFSLEINADGSPRFFIRNAANAVVELLCDAGLVRLNQAYTAIARWGAPGMALELYDDAGTLLDRATNTDLSPLAGTSPLRFGAWHLDTAHHNGPFGRVVWLNRRLSDAKAGLLARARTITHVTIVTSNLPFLGRYYGGDCQGAGAANTHMKATSEMAVSYFFYAERTGTIDRIMYNRRTAGPGEGYSGGDGGRYTFEIRTADATTRGSTNVSSLGRLGKTAGASRSVLTVGRTGRTTAILCAPSPSGACEPVQRDPACRLDNQVVAAQQGHAISSPPALLLGTERMQRR